MDSKRLLKIQNREKNIFNRNFQNGESLTIDEELAGDFFLSKQCQDCDVRPGRSRKDYHTLQA